MKTEPLYYKDIKLFEFDAKVLAAESGEYKKQNVIELLLDRTAFYPEGGGQPADRGLLGGTPVLHVKKSGGEILHILAEDGGPLPAPGETIHGEVDAEYRRDYQQQHTGQHILSAVFMELGNYATVSVHQGEEYTTIEFETPEIPEDFLAIAEERANAVVCENHPVKIHWTDAEGLAGFKLRRPSKQNTNIRIVEIEGADTVACGGVHLASTGETGTIKLIGTEKIRGNTRTFWKIGKRALEDYRLKNNMAAALSNRLSVPTADIEAAFEKVLSDSAAKDAEIKGLKEDLAGLKAEALAARAAADGGILTEAFENEDKDTFRNTALKLAEQPGLKFCLINRTPGGSGWILGHGTESELDFNRLRSELLVPLGVKGGGRPPLWQGGGLAPEKEAEFTTLWETIAKG